MTHEEIVAEYIETRRTRGREEANFYRTLPSFKEAIRHAVRPGGRKHSHQFRIPPRVLDEAERCLTRAAPQLAATADFPHLLDQVEQSAGEVRGIGDLAIYDIAQRLGLHLGKSPDLVYLHCGAKAGAAYLGFRGKTLDPKRLPRAFSRLTAAELEDCLCIYKDALLNGASSTRNRGCLPAQTRPSTRC